MTSSPPPWRSTKIVAQFVGETVERRSTSFTTPDLLDEDEDRSHLDRYNHFETARQLVAQRADGEITDGELWMGMLPYVHVRDSFDDRGLPVSWDDDLASAADPLEALCYQLANSEPVTIAAADATELALEIPFRWRDLSGLMGAEGDAYNAFAAAWTAREYERASEIASSAPVAETTP